MSNSDSIQTQHKPISYADSALVIGQTLLKSIQKVVWHEGKLNITGTDKAGDSQTLTGLATADSIEQLEKQRRVFPNASIISKCLGLAQLSTGEAILAEEAVPAGEDQQNPGYFQESINSLERALEQEPGDPEATLYLTLAYCYAEDLEGEISDDYAELVNDLLTEVPLTLLPEIAAACAIRGKIYFEENRATLGFNFLKQELFLWRHQQLLDPENTALLNRVKLSAEDLIQRCEQQGWKGIAAQLILQLPDWISSATHAEDADALDHRLAEAAEFERAGRAYLSHNDKASALTSFIDHTALMKVIYQDHAPMSCYADLLIESYIRLIDLHYELEQPDQGSDLQLELIALLESLLIPYPDSETYLNSLAACCESLAERRVSEGMPVKALALYLQSLSLNQHLSSLENDLEQYTNNQIAVLRKLIPLYHETGNEVAAHAYQQQIETLEESLSTNQSGD